LIAAHASPLPRCPLSRCPPLFLRVALSTPALSTLACSCYVVHSCVVQPCFIVPTCPLPRCPLSRFQRPPFDLKSGVRVTCSVAILVFLMASLFSTSTRCTRQSDRSQTNVRQHHRLMPPPIRGGGIIIRNQAESKQYGASCSFSAARELHVISKF